MYEKGEKEGHIHQCSHRKIKKGELEREKKGYSRRGFARLLLQLVLT